MDSDELISIVIPCYNQAHLLPKAVESCLAQTYQNIEIIVVDDGSPDNVREAIMPYLTQVKLISQENCGLSMARNAGLAEAKGRFIKFLDADDWLLNNCIELQYKTLSHLAKHICVIGYSCVYDDIYPKHHENFYPEFGRLSNQLCYVNPGPPHIYLFFTDAVRSVGGFDNSSRIKGGHEDYDILCRLSLMGYEAIALHYIGVVYRKYSDSMSKNQEGMRISRSRVWQHYARSMLLKNKSDLESLIWLLGGYVLRLRDGGIRYDANDILIDAINQLLQKQNLISKMEAFDICLKAASILRNLSKPNEKEITLRNQAVKMLELLIAISWYKIVIDISYTFPKIRIFAQWFKRTFWNNRNQIFRKIILKIISKCNLAFYYYRIIKKFNSYRPF